MSDTTSTTKPKRTISDEQKAKMKAALDEKKADPVWQEEQKKKREARKAKKEEEKAVAKKAIADKKEEEKAAKKADSDGSDKPKKVRKELTPEAKLAAIEKRKATIAAKKVKDD